MQIVFGGDPKCGLIYSLNRMTREGGIASGSPQCYLPAALSPLYRPDPRVGGGYANSVRGRPQVWPNLFPQQ